jgi:hypothetical protein
MDVFDIIAVFMLLFLSLKEENKQYSSNLFHSLVLMNWNRMAVTGLLRYGYEVASGETMSSELGSLTRKEPVYEVVYYAARKCQTMLHFCSFMLHGVAIANDWNQFGKKSVQSYRNKVQIL